MTTNNKLSLLIKDHIPDYVDEFYPLFIIFVTKYYEWLEQQGNPQEVLQNLQLNRDVDTTVSSLTSKFLLNYVPNFPQKYEASSELLVKYFRDFYERKGSESSFNFFFRAFFNDDITVSRPRDKLFKTSDGIWNEPKKLRVSSISGNPFRLLHTWIEGSSTGARAAVNLIQQITTGNYFDLLLDKDSLTGTFSSSETISGYFYDFDLDTSSQIILLNTEDLITEEGFWKNTRSQLSSDQVLQDSFYYQDYSYVIRSKINLEDWRDSILNELHPAGQIMFNEMLLETEPTLITTSDTLQISTVVSTNIGLSTSEDFYLSSGYSFDRTADFYTGTSAGAIVYDANYFYKGENITFALQKPGDSVLYSVPKTVEVLFDGVSFDKIGSRIILEEQLIAWDSLINTSTVTKLYHNTSNIILTSNTLLASYSSTGVSSTLLLITWMKDILDNSTSETSNALFITISSTVTSVSSNYFLSDYFLSDYFEDTYLASKVYFEDETQRNYKRVALDETLLYPKLSYYNSSNSIINNTNYIEGNVLFSQINFTFNPFNANRDNSFSRAVFRIDQRNATSFINVYVSSNSIFSALTKDHLNITMIGA